MDTKVRTGHRVVQGRIALRGLLLLVIFCAFTAPLAADELDETAIDIGTAKQLFIDQRLVAASQGVTLTMNTPDRDRRALIGPDQPWEQGSTIAPYCSVIKEDGKVRLWYDSSRATGDGPKKASP